MAYEFKKLSAVEVVAEPAESANVLIEENGVIKKAPKTSVGGGNTEWDAVFEYNGFDETITYVSGNYNTVYNKILVDEEIPNIKIKTYTEYGWGAYGIEKGHRITVVVNPEDSTDHYIVFERPQTCMNSWNQDLFISWYPDNSVEFY